MAKAPLSIDLSVLPEEHRATVLAAITALSEVKWSQFFGQLGDFAKVYRLVCPTRGAHSNFWGFLKRRLQRSPSKGGMRVFLVVINPPVFDDLARLADAREPVLVQTLISEPAIETFDVGVLGRLARIDEVQLHTVIIGPGDLPPGRG